MDNKEFAKTSAIGGMEQSVTEGAELRKATEKFATVLGLIEIKQNSSTHKTQYQKKGKVK